MVSLQMSKFRLFVLVLLLFFSASAFSLVSRQCEYSAGVQGNGAGWHISYSAAINSFCAARNSVPGYSGCHLDYWINTPGDCYGGNGIWKGRYINEYGGVLEVRDGVAVYIRQSCPANSVLSGSQCQCVTGFEEKDGKCIKPESKICTKDQEFSSVGVPLGWFDSSVLESGITKEVNDALYGNWNTTACHSGCKVLITGTMSGRGQDVYITDENISSNGSKVLLFGNYYALGTGESCDDTSDPTVPPSSGDPNPTPTPDFDPMPNPAPGDPTDGGGSGGSSGGSGGGSGGSGGGSGDSGGGDGGGDNGIGFPVDDSAGNDDDNNADDDSDNSDTSPDTGNSGDGGGNNNSGGGGGDAGGNTGGDIGGGGTNSSGGSGEGDSEGEDDSWGCKLFPNTLGCFEFGDIPGDDGINRDTVSLSLDADNTFPASGVCPPDPRITFFGTTIEVPLYSIGCDWLRKFIRPVAILLSTFFSLMIVTGVTRD
jgi:hypothetical protein